ncbi:MAG: hypothetical protein P1R58_03490 [bacterium]|nr:hypothetical protein [bacterium]
MKKTLLYLTAALVLILLANCSQGVKKVKLSYKYVPGLHLEYEQHMTRAIKVLAKDSIIKDYDRSLVVRVVQEVKSVTEDQIATIYEEDHWSFEAPSKEDSLKIDTMTETHSFTVSVSPNGKLHDVDFGEDASITSASYNRTYWEQGMPEFPDDEVGPGHSWTQTNKVVLPDETLEASTTFKVKSLVREAGYDCAVIEFDGDMVIPLVPDPADSTQRTGLDRIKSTGMIYFAYREGIVVLQRERWVVDGTRQKMEKGEMLHYQIAVESDSEYILKKMQRK